MTEAPGLPESVPADGSYCQSTPFVLDAAAYFEQVPDS